MWQFQIAIMWAGNTQKPAYCCTITIKTRRGAARRDVAVLKKLHAKTQATTLPATGKWETDEIKRKAIATKNRHTCTAWQEIKERIYFDDWGKEIELRSSCVKDLFSTVVNIDTPAQEAKQKTILNMPNFGKLQQVWEMSYWNDVNCGLTENCLVSIFSCVEASFFDDDAYWLRNCCWLV